MTRRSAALAAASLAGVLSASCTRDLDRPGPLPTTGYLSGRLVQAVPGTDQNGPVASGTVSIPGTNLATISDALGNFTIGPLPRGTYKLLLKGTPPASEGSPAQRQRILFPAAVRPGATAALGDLVLQENAAVEGRALLSGKATGNLGIIISVPGTDYTTTAADSGAFILRQLPEGAVRVSAFLPGYRPVTTSDLQLQGSAVTPVDDLLLVPEPAQPSRIRGGVLVVGAADNGGVTVKAISLTAQKVAATQTTAADGTFTLAALPPDVYTLTAEVSDRPVGRVPNLTVGAGVDVNLDALLLAPANSSGAPVQCTAGTQCDTGRLCLSGVCSDCSTNAQCGVGSSCSGGRCQRDCAGNADCPGQVCSAGRCRPCAASSECGDPALACIAGTCAHCQSRGDCGPGEACLAPGCGSCVSDADCGAGATCTAGLCAAAACASNDACPASQACLGGQCGSCSVDGQCRAGQLCVGSACVAGSCRTSSQCAQGLVCATFQCTACASDADCGGAGNLCLPTAQGSRCAPGDCRTTTDCHGTKGGQLCLGNTCTDCGAGVSCGSGQVCAPQTGGAHRCVPGDCAAPPDCTGPEAGWLCTANRCTPCALDTDCAPLGKNLICDVGACGPTQCAVRADCTSANAGKVCRSQRCAACAPGDCAPGEQCTGGLCVQANLFAVTVSPGAGGAVSSSPGPISCTGGSGTCAGVFLLGDVVTLTASPSTGFFFGGWTGGPGCGVLPTCTFAVAGNTTVAAAFNAGATLAVTTSGPGTVTSTPAALSCPGTCSATFGIGATLTLQATPIAGYSFAGWSGGGCSGTGSCALTLAQATTVTTAFVKQPVLTVVPGGAGAGTLISSPAGINCALNGGVESGQCSAPFPSGTAVTLTEAALGAPFGGWLSGGCSGTAATCAVTLVADTAVSAAFGTTYSLSLTVAGPGAVGANSGAIAGCGRGGACGASYPAGVAVVLTAVPVAGAALGAWGGDCAASTGSSCTLAMSQARTATASFNAVTTISVVQGDQQSATATALLPSSVILKVSDTTGAALASAPVQLAGPAGAVVTPAVATTDGSGHAVFAVRLAPTSGAQSFTATTPTAVAPLTVSATSAKAAPGTLTTQVDVDHVAGATGIPGSALGARINGPAGIAVSADGTTYVAGSGNNQVFAVSPAGVLTVVAGTGTCGSSGDNGPASAALLCSPTDLALDETHARRTLYFIQASTVRTIDLTASPPLISTFAGGGTAPSPGFGDGGPANAAALNTPRHVVVDPAGNYLYIVDGGNNRIRRVSLSSLLISAWVSIPNPQANANYGTGLNGTNDRDCALAFDSAGVAYMSYSNQPLYNPPAVVARVNADLSLTVIAGGGSSTADGATALAAQIDWSLVKLLFDRGGNLYLVESAQNRVRRLEAGTGRIGTVVGTGSAGALGDFGDARQAQLSAPWSAALDSALDLIITDRGNNSVRAVWSEGAAAPANATLSVVSGTPQSVVVDQPAAPLAVRLLDPAGQPLAGYPISWSAVDAGGAILGVSNTDLSGNATATVRAGLAAPGPYRFNASFSAFTGPIPGTTQTFTLSTTAPGAGSMFTVADTDHSAGSDGYPGAATRAHLNRPAAVVSASDGTVYFADPGNNLLVALAPSGQLSVLAGTGTCGHLGDGGPAASAQLCGPTDLALDESGGQETLYLIDQNLIRAIDLKAATPLIATVAGGGTAPAPGYGDGGPATAAALNAPRHIVLSPARDYLYVVDSGINRIRRVSLATFTISAWLSIPNPQFNAVCSTGLNSTVDRDCLLAFDNAQVPYISYGYQALYNPPVVIARVNPDLSLSTVAGGGSNTGEGVPAASAAINWSLWNMYFSAAGDLYYVENQLHRVRKIASFATNPTISTVVGTGTAGNGVDLLSPLGTALNAPFGIAFTADGKMVVTDSGNHAVRAIWPPVP